DQQCLRIPETAKVLSPMKTFRAEPVEPVLCMWDAMHPDGDIEPWFSINLPEGSHFDRLWIFSISSYLRTISDEYIAIEMTDTMRRLHWLNRLLVLGQM